MMSSAGVHPAAPPAGSAPPLPRVWKADRMLGIIGLSMWLGTTFRVWPVLPPIDRMQCCLGLLVSECMGRERHGGVLCIWWLAQHCQQGLLRHLPLQCLV